MTRSDPSRSAGRTCRDCSTLKAFAACGTCRKSDSSSELARRDFAIVFPADERFSDPEPRALPVRRRFRTQPLLERIDRHDRRCVDVVSRPATLSRKSDDCLNASRTNSGAGCSFRYSWPVSIAGMLNDVVGNEPA